MIQKKENFKNLVRIDNLVDGGQAVSRLSVVPNTDLVAAPVSFTPVKIYTI